MHDDADSATDRSYLLGGDAKMATDDSAACIVDLYTS